MQLSRGESVRDTALVLSRYVAAIGVRTGPHGPWSRARRARARAGREHAHGGPPSVPGARRPAHAEGALRPARGAEAGLRRRRQQRRPLADDRSRPRRASRSPSPPRPSWRPSRSGARTRRDRPGARPSQAAHAVYTDVWFSMGDEDAAAKRELLEPYRLDEALLGARAPTTPSRCTACRRTSARRSPPMCSTARARRSGTRRRTGCTRRRPCLSCSSPARLRRMKKLLVLLIACLALTTSPPAATTTMTTTAVSSGRHDRRPSRRTRAQRRRRASGGGATTVDMKDIEFVPEGLTVKAGHDRSRGRTATRSPHTVTKDGGPGARLRLGQRRPGRHVRADVRRAGEGRLRLHDPPRPGRHGHSRIAAAASSA